MREVRRGYDVVLKGGEHHFFECASMSMADGALVLDLWGEYRVAFAPGFWLSCMPGTIESEMLTAGVEAGPERFDRLAYQREYMRKRRAAARERE